MEQNKKVEFSAEDLESIGEAIDLDMKDQNGRIAVLRTVTFILATVVASQFPSARNVMINLLENHFRDYIPPDIDQSSPEFIAYKNAYESEASHFINILRNGEGE